MDSYNLEYIAHGMLKIRKWNKQGFELAHPTVSGRELTFHYHFIYYVLCYTFKPKKRTCCSFC